MTRYVAMENGDMLLCKQGTWVKYDDYEKVKDEVIDLTDSYDMLYSEYKELKKKLFDTQVAITKFATDVTTSIKVIDRAFDLYGIRKI